MKRSSNTSPNRDLFWMTLDNAGKIFPAENTETWSHMIRETVVLKADVDPDVLTQALSDIMPRFPMFAVRMREGFFWNYLQENEKRYPKVRPDVNNPCVRIKWHENDGFLFRVFYHKNRISVEFFHAITDGYGMTCFIMTLVHRYLTLMGEKIPVGGFVLDINEQPSEDELSDAFLKFNDYKGKEIKSRTGVYHFVGTKLPPHRIKVTTGYLSVKKIKKFAIKHGVTITEFLSAVSLYALYKQQEGEVGTNNWRKMKPVGIQIPMNGRFKLPTKTLRNFSLSTYACIVPRKQGYTFEQVLEVVAKDLRRSATRDNFKAMIRSNIALESNPVIRVIPLPLKNLVIGTIYNIVADNDTSVLITNLGKIDIPGEMLQHIDRAMLFPAPGRVCGARGGVATIGDVLALSFMNIYKETDIERRIFGEFRRMGLDVSVESNYPFDEPGIDSSMPYSKRLMIPNAYKVRILTIGVVVDRILKRLFFSAMKRQNPFDEEWINRFFYY